MHSSWSQVQFGTIVICKHPQIYYLDAGHKEPPQFLVHFTPQIPVNTDIVGFFYGWVSIASGDFLIQLSNKLRQDPIQTVSWGEKTNLMTVTSCKNFPVLLRQEYIILMVVKSSIVIINRIFFTINNHKKKGES